MTEPEIGTDDGSLVLMRRHYVHFSALERDAGRRASQGYILP